MGAKAHRLKLRLFLEGMEVPVIAVQVQSAPNSPVMASIQIPPLAEATRLHPRTLVHVFFEDFYETASPLISYRGNTKAKEKNPSIVEQSLHDNGAVDPITGLPMPDLRNERYKLLFCGEIMGFQYTKRESQRAIILQCADLSNYWDYAYQWQNTDLFGPGYKAIMSGGSTNMFTDFLSSKSEDIITALRTPSANYPALKGLLGGVVHLLEKIGGSYYTEQKLVGQNYFFSFAELRLRITQMITAYPEDTTAQKLLDGNGFGAFFGRVLGGLGEQVSFRDAINSLMAIIFHETYGQPCPLYVPGTGGTQTGHVRKKLRDNPKTASIAVDCESAVDTLTGIKTVYSAKTVDSSRRRATGISLASLSKLLNGALAKAKTEKVQRAQSHISTALRAVGAARTRAANPDFLSADEGNPKIVERLNEAIEKLKAVASLELITSSPKDTPARLNQQIFRPDIWFSSPPRCNVLFPDQYNSNQYSRDFMKEPTRLLLKTNDAFFGEDELFDKFYFAPKAFTLKSEKANMQAMLRNDILDHELFTGILPVFEKMSETNIFAIKSGTVGGKIPKVGLAQRSCNFLYFKYKFAARQMQVSGHFNPYLAAGFPGLVLDKYVDLAQASSIQDQLQRATGANPRELRKLIGTHFLGNFQNIAHNISQDGGGSTQIDITYPRQWDEETQFLGAILKDDQKITKKVSDATRTTDVAAFTAPKIGTIGPNYGIVGKVEDVTTQHRPTAATKEGSQLPLYRGSRRKGKDEFRLRVPVGETKSAREYGPEVVELVGNENLPVTFRAFRIHEKAPVYRREEIDMPMERLIMPGWYTDVWDPVNIGKAYEFFFRTGSITDETQVADPAGGSTGAASATARDAVAEAYNGSKAVDDPQKDVPAVLSLQKNATISQAVAFLCLTYSYIKQSGLDADEFIRAYTWRPIASMPDMFGTSNLALDSRGEEVIEGVEGFHSRAFGPYENLFGLVTPSIETILGITRNSSQAKKGDTRLRKLAAVKDYISALSSTRGILG